MQPYDTLVSKQLYVHHLFTSKDIEEEAGRLREEINDLISNLKR
jgi:hypothetical protein